jgi:hypothetical protein
MTLNQRPVLARLNCLPDREANARPDSAVGVPAQAPHDQLQHAPIDRKPGGHCEWSPIAPPLLRDNQGETPRQSG